MKKSLTTMLFLSSSLALAGSSAITIMDDDKLGQEMKQSYTGHVNTVKKAADQLADDTLVFETAQQDSDFQVEIEGVKTSPPKYFTLRSIKTTETVHEIDKLAVINRNSVTSELTAMKMSNGKVVFYSDKSVKNSDYNKVDCKNCEEVWSGYVFEQTITTARDAAAGRATGRRTGTGTGVDSTMARPGKLKGKVVTAGDKGMLSICLDQFSNEPETEVVVAYEKLSFDQIEDLQNAKSIKIIVPIAMDKEITLKTIDIAIKEQGVKLSIEGGIVTATYRVKVKIPALPREKE